MEPISAHSRLSGKTRCSLTAALKSELVFRLWEIKKRDAPPTSTDLQSAEADVWVCLWIPRMVLTCTDIFRGYHCIPGRSARAVTSS